MVCQSYYHGFPFSFSGRPLRYTRPALNAGPVEFSVLGASTDRGRSEVYLFGESQSPKLPLSRPIPPTLSLPPTSLVAEICFGLRLAYPAGDGSPAILDSMLAKSRLVR
jgi:hypothetical protein